MAQAGQWLEEGILFESVREHDQGDTDNHQRRVKPQHSQVGDAFEI
jgi:hypothetical protein